jgi:hypothetical protein
LIAVRALDADAATRRQDQLIELLVDAVEGGASIGFVLPLERAEAGAYWQGVTAGLREGRLALIAASRSLPPLRATAWSARSSSA